MLVKRNLKILLCLTVALCLTVSSGVNLTVYAADKEKEDEYVVFTEDNIKTTDMRKKSNVNEKMLTEYMKKFPSLSGIEETLVEVQEDYGVNAILILAIVRLESGNGKSSIAKSRNNLGGLVGWSNSVRVYKSFDSKSDCVVYMAKLLSENYLTDGGKYFNGYTLPDISKKYSTASEKWTELVEDMIYDIQEDINEIEV